MRKILFCFILTALFCHHAIGDTAEIGDSVEIIDTVGEDRLQQRQNHLQEQRDNDLQQQRQSYEKALQALRKGRRSEFKTLAAQLTDYPLYPYLEYAELSTRLRLSARNDVDTFIEQHPNTPITKRLTHRWLEYLRKRNHWRTYLDYPQAKMGTTQQQCYYYLAAYRNGDKDEAIAAGLKLWSVGKSQPKACDRLFGILIDQQRITEQLAWNRFTKAVLNRNYQLARYLKRFFSSDDYQQLARLFYTIDRKPQTLKNLTIKSEQVDSLLPAVERGIIRKAKRNSLTALGYWSRYQQMYTFSPKAENKIISALVKGLYKQEHFDVADNYLKDNRYKVDATLTEWRIRQAIRKADWQDTLDWIALLPAEYQQEKRWNYWRIRAEQLLNPNNANDYAQQYATLSDARNYYSFLASEQAGLGYNLEHMPSAPSAEDVLKIESLPAFQRIRELLFHTDLASARREWNLATRNFSESQWVSAAHVATRFGWYSHAISSMIQAGYWNDIDIRFPIVHKELFAKQAKKIDVPLPWLFALARQESSLASDATSPVGARGLMQLMPATAKETAKKHQVPLRSTEQLYQPEMNVLLGSRYFRQMLDRFDNNRILATAAYNAGPHRVDRWLEKTATTLPFDAWVEQIPFKETRNYVQSIMAFSAIYAHHLNIEQTILNDGEKQSLL